MDAQVVNLNAYSSGSMLGVFDLVATGLVITGCKALLKDGRLLFSSPAEKKQRKDGAERWRDIVTAAELANAAK